MKSPKHITILISPTTTCNPRHPLKSDRRYTVTREYTGHITGKPRHVVRFCGAYLGDCDTYPAAVAFAIARKDARDIALIQP